MKNKLIPLLGIAFVVALITTGVFYGLFAGKLSSVSTRGPVVVAARALPKNTRLGASDMKVVNLDPVPRGSFVAVGQVVGFTVTEPVDENHVILESKVVEQRKVTAGMRAISVHVTDSSGVVGMLQPGHHVDVQVVGSPTRSDTTMVLRTVLENVEVLSTSPLDTGRPVVNLLATPQQADMLGLADSTQRIRLTLRNLGDSEMPTLTAIQPADLFRNGK